MGVIGGYADGTFRPDAPISRAEFAKIAVSFTQNNGSAVYNYFTDVKTTDWFAPYVTAAKDAGLIEGYSDGSFKPESKITRAEACAIVNRTLGRKPSKAHMKISGRIDWPDVQTTDWFYEAIMEATNSHTCTRWASASRPGTTSCRSATGPPSRPAGRMPTPATAGKSAEIGKRPPPRKPGAGVYAPRCLPL